MSQPIYAAFTGNTLKILPLSPYRDIIPEGTVINGFPDGIRGSVGVKLVKIEDGMFERVFFDLDGTKNTEYYPVKVTTADIGDGHPLIIREHLTNDESCLWLNDLLDGPEKYLLGEFEKTRRNEPSRFVFMRKYEYPDDMYEIHNPETKKCNVIDVSTGQLMFPEWCDSVEFMDGKWSRSNTPTYTMESEIRMNVPPSLSLVRLNKQTQYTILFTENEEFCAKSDREKAKNGFPLPVFFCGKLL